MLKPMTSIPVQVVLYFVTYVHLNIVPFALDECFQTWQMELNLFLPHFIHSKTVPENNNFLFPVVENTSLRFSGISNIAN
jgi:hypothetical protein